MTAKQQELLKAKKWSEFLMTLLVNNQYVVIVDSVRDIESLKSVVWRINARGELAHRFQTKADYKQRALIINVVPNAEETPNTK